MPQAPVRILIAEDDESLRQLLVRYLTSLGHDVDAVPDGTTAVSALGGTRYDVIVTDVIMPGHNGLEVLRAAKEFDRLTEVIVLTGAPDLSTAVKALREGDAYDYIVKPFPNVEILRATVERALSEPEASTMHHCTRLRRRSCVRVDHCTRIIYEHKRRITEW